MVNNQNKNQGLVRKGAIALVLMAGLLGACEGNQPQADAPVTNDREAMDNRANEDDQQAANQSDNTVPGTDNSGIAQNDTDQAATPVPGTENSTIAQTDTDQAATSVPGGENSTMVQTETDEVEEVADNSDQLIGQTVTIKGEVEEAYGSNLYRVQEQGEVFGDSILVIAVPAQPGATTSLAADQNVQVTGQVRELVMAEFEKDYDLNWDLSVKEQIEAEYEGKPVVVAETVQVYE